MVKKSGEPNPVFRSIMRAVISRIIFRPVRKIPQRPGLAVCVLGFICLGTICDADDSDKKLARLGFTFSQRAHDLAIAAATTNDSGDSRATEASTDDLLNLPKFVVIGQRTPLVAREILTPKAKLDLAKTTYLTPVYQKTLGRIAALASLLVNPLGGWQPNNPEAMALYEDTEQLRRKTEMTELIKKQQR